MIKIGVHSDDKVIVQAIGRLGEKDIINLGIRLGELAMPRLHGKAVFHLEGLRTVRLPASGGSTASPASLKGRRLARVALIGDRRLERTARRLVSNLVHGEIRFFGLGQDASARRWLDRPGLGRPGHRLLPARV